MIQTKSEIYHVDKKKETLTITTDKNIIFYDLNNNKITEQLDVTEFIGNIIKSILFAIKMINMNIL